MEETGKRDIGEEKEKREEIGREVLGHIFKQVIEMEEGMLMGAYKWFPSIELQ